MKALKRLIEEKGKCEIIQRLLIMGAGGAGSSEESSGMNWGRRTGGTFMS